MEEIVIDTIEWSAPEYNHKADRHIDWFWTIGLLSIVFCGITIWQHNYLFAVFILISGGCLIMFTMRPPENITFTIETQGLTMGREKYSWKRIKGFHIVKDGPRSKLLVETNKYFLPVYTMPLPEELIKQVRENLTKVTPNIELKESQSLIFMEKIGF
jgi:hypothetical protein